MIESAESARAFECFPIGLDREQRDLIMAREPVFCSFNSANDVFRAQRVRNMGVVHGEERVSPNDWETRKRKGETAVEKWIDGNMNNTRCVIVLIGGKPTAALR
jgi:hypothetical protein